MDRRRDGGKMDRVGFVGLGAMGEPMARRLLGADTELVVYDRATERVEALVDAGASGASSAQEAGEGAGALILMVATPDQAEEALFGTEGGADVGAASGMSPGSAVVVMSTIGPRAVRSLAERLAEGGLRLLDAPVSGGVARAEAGDLLIMAGGPTGLFEGLRPVLDAMGSTVAHCGEDAGDGQAVKLVNQLLCGVHIAAAAEALSFAGALGIDPRFAFETIRHGAANSFMLVDRGERMLEREFTPPKSALDIFVKDMGLVEEAAADHGFRAPLTGAVRRLYEMGSQRGLGGEDDSGVIRLFEEGIDGPLE
jgi:3-hydroxyisobutyrate dehydrogenase-like beta-hydroxyacid dehydrogenase